MIIATVLVNAARPNGFNVVQRILLDSASEANFIMQLACNKLGVKRDRASEIVTGLNEMQSEINEMQLWDHHTVEAFKLSRERSLFGGTDNYKEFSTS